MNFEFAMISEPRGSIATENGAESGPAGSQHMDFLVDPAQ